MKSLLLLLLAFCQTVFGTIWELTDKNFEKKAFGQQGMYSFVYIYSPYCNFCNEMTPQFAALADLYDNTKLQLFQINGYANKRVSKKYEVVAFPVLKIFSSDGTDMGSYTGVRGTQNFIDYIHEVTGVSPSFPDSLVKQPTSKELEDIIKDTKRDVLVAFSQPWLKGWEFPYTNFYESLARYYAEALDDSATTFVRVDVSDAKNAEIVSKFQVSKTPSVFHFASYREHYDQANKLFKEDLGPVEIVQLLEGAEELVTESIKLSTLSDSRQKDVEESGEADNSFEEYAQLREL
ncbi:BA75_04539T0 [Komagataella pastoris]|uniref:BA75_04539T0 n=1 Tax=Komagataella pastoris TaxID=4922 RepID=A0A1B2JHU4_PICPA|nr:BA75_04539T0 [Komagataella pastoris]